MFVCFISKNPFSVSLTIFYVHHPQMKTVYLSHNLAKCPDLLSNIAVSVLQCSNTKMIFKLNYKYKYVM